jgi:UDP-GlcNAc:undecaprenyl-phosphate GlcNAc-1-phosphate transferase
MASGLIAGGTVALIVALAALLMTSWAGVQVRQLGNLFGFDPVQTYDWALPFSVIWAIGVIDAVNMVDGLDGSAGGISFVAMLWLAYVALLQKLSIQALLLLVRPAAVAGFLVWNIRLPPLRDQARIFIGDSGA